MNSESEHTLHRLEQNDSRLIQLQIGGTRPQLQTPCPRPGMFNSSDSGDFSRLGDYIGENTHLKHLDVRYSVGLNLTNDRFYEGLKRNTSIHKLGINFRGQVIVEESGLGLKILDAYQENSNHLTWLCISNAGLQNGGENVITTTLRRCTNLQQIALSCCNINDEQLLQNIVEAVRERHSLKKFGLVANRIGNVGCETLATLL